MSMAGTIDSERSHHHHKKFFHYRNDSGELDVFEAARYFSGYNEAVGYNNGCSGFTQKIIMREDHRHSGHRGRISLDMPMRSLLPQHFHSLEKHGGGKEKKHNKQPSSPGGRLASFLNSLFSQSASKKKKAKSKSTSQSMKDEDESPGGRRLRRSSISHFRSSSTTADSSKSLYSSFSSGFRTPPYVQTPTKSCKEFRTFSENQKQNQQQAAVSVTKCNYNNIGHVKSTSFQNVTLWDDKKKRDHQKPTILDENYKTSRNVVSEKQCPPPEEKEFKKFINEVDDGAESDSSSDLFELQNYDLGYYPSGLPVYETTNMDNIKRGEPISNGPL
ncbi:hypothetical protein QN277_004026 [Acacia crassicarpa]|uniref:Protein BIG GRAIN 1-like E n=1 Tax=Acacia crassicarpa TaxID=499986 RepID=A0AAE1J3G1_9FABA|nr:hypothetical protein QN277_004026 [Acacia crassicarpa]